MASRATNRAVAQVVRVKEIQEYDVEVVPAGDNREAAKLARRRFLSMTVDEQSANSIGVTARTFGVGEDEFDEDELAAEPDA